MSMGSRDGCLTVGREADLRAIPVLTYADWGCAAAQTSAWMRRVDLRCAEGRQCPVTYVDVTYVNNGWRVESLQAVDLGTAEVSPVEGHHSFLHGPHTTRRRNQRVEVVL